MNKTALITGASRGIGKAIALELARSGYDIVVGYNERQEEADKVAEKAASYNVRAITAQADLKDYVSVKSMFDYVYSVFSSIDVLINNAGISLVKPILDTTIEEWREIMDANLTSAYLTTQFVLPKMINKEYGRIINISSIWGVTGASCEVAYSASKAGLIGYTKALALEVPPYITVNCITPGIIDTDMNSDLDEEEIEKFLKNVPAGRMGEPQEVASLVAYLASDKAAYVNGQVIGVNGGMC